MTICGNNAFPEIPYVVITGYQLHGNHVYSNTVLLSSIFYCKKDCWFSGYTLYGYSFHTDFAPAVFMFLRSTRFRASRSGSIEQKEAFSYTCLLVFCFAVFLAYGIRSNTATYPSFMLISPSESDFSMLGYKMAGTVSSACSCFGWLSIKFIDSLPRCFLLTISHPCSNIGCNLFLYESTTQKMLDIRIDFLVSTTLRTTSYQEVSRTCHVL